jgi:hypothetical protein
MNNVLLAKATACADDFRDETFLHDSETNCGAWQKKKKK